VRRAARGCDDLPSLLTKLAEQVTNPGAKAAFLQQAAQHTTQPVATTGGTNRSTVAPGLATAGGAPAAAPIDDATLAQATRLLAQHVGPIASVLARRAVARAPDRVAFFGALAEAVADGKAREQLRAALDRLA